MLDDGIGPAVFDEIQTHYLLPDEVDLYDVGCMSMDMISHVDKYDLIITVDAVDGTDAQPGTVFRYEPYDIARNEGAVLSLHDLKLADLFDAAGLMGYSAQGMCYGMQVANMSPEEFVVGLTPQVHEKLSFLVESVIAELVRRGHVIRRKSDNSLVTDPCDAEANN